MHLLQALNQADNLICVFFLRMIGPEIRGAGQSLLDPLWPIGHTPLLLCHLTRVVERALFWPSQKRDLDKLERAENRIKPKSERLWII